MKGWRLWAGFGGWEWSRVKEVLVETPKKVIWKACEESLGWKGNRGFRQKMETVDWLYLRTIEEGWELGRGPDGRKYSECRPAELMRRQDGNRSTTGPERDRPRGERIF